MRLSSDHNGWTFFDQSPQIVWFWFLETHPKTSLFLPSHTFSDTLSYLTGLYSSLISNECYLFDDVMQFVWDESICVTKKPKKGMSTVSLNTFLNSLLFSPFNPLDRSALPCLKSLFIHGRFEVNFFFFFSLILLFSVDCWSTHSHGLLSRFACAVALVRFFHFSFCDNIGGESFHLHRQLIWCFGFIDPFTFTLRCWIIPMEGEQQRGF